ncbi:centrosomal protein of 95 kDa-like isoform X2 [Periophthalmus magnuspinnatus]|uniref:centrosomal protein of 95 kDa-like isoform X2 n=1 Tax=Periophthalmus magnuspinnatus TaxID=409849 RepID=UPI00145AF06B|nr:centrosomal protein of 95 kDa-like isoform X2 [Periophthalmus magnuspinnatus]
MGSQEFERDCVDVANELLSKCHLNLRLRKLTDCDASVFITLYESILGEKVPDYVAAPRCQEDDIHNVQSVIDSLSLDYLQISLSHITGENVVRGDKESIKNLLEIFDGLLEYLNEDTSEESQNSEPNNSPNEDIQNEEKEPEPEGASVSSSAESGAQSSIHSHHSPNPEDVAINDGVHTSEEHPSACPPFHPQSEAIPSAVPLRPPSQSQSHTLHPESVGLHTASAEEGADQTTAQFPETVLDRRLDHPSLIHSPALSERSLSRQNSNNTDLDKETLELKNGGPRKVLFRTQPDVLFLTLQDETGATDSSPSDAEEDKLDTAYNQQTRSRRTGHRQRTNQEKEDVEPLSSRRQRNKKTEEELHNISENLSHRLEELDQMLKRVLCEPGESSEVRREDRHLHDNPMERISSSQQHPDLPDPKPECSQTTSSPSPLRPPQREPVEDSFFVDDGRQSNLTDQSKGGRPTHRLSQRKLRKYLLDKLYQEELERYEDKERVELDRARLRALEAEREYRETILKDASKVHKQTPMKPKPQQRSPRKTVPSTGRKLHDTVRKAPSLKVKDNDLLPVLAEELPHLHISSRVLRQMWEEQMRQVDRLHSMSSSRSQRRNKLSEQLEEAHRKYNLLVEINRKEQDHSRRLREFKERIQQQKLTQSKLREQRQQIARAKKYHNEYHVQHRARLMRARTKEERMFRQLFEEGLSVQKDRLIEQRAYAREQQLEHQKRHEDFITSMENYYKDQFSLLAEKLAQERQDIQIRKKAQEKALLKMKRELRGRMEREIRELQKIILENDEDEYFQDLDVQRLRNQMHLASFSYNTSYLP